jgi:hypothetical protein
MVRNVITEESYLECICNTLDMTKLSNSSATATAQPHTFRNKWQPEKRECVEVGELMCIYNTLDMTKLSNSSATATAQPHTFRNKWQPEKRECVEVGELIELLRSVLYLQPLAPQLC